MTNSNLNKSIAYQYKGDPDSNEQILLLHGWAMNSGIWSDVMEFLTQQYPHKLIRAIDLPGCGHSVDYPIAAEHYNSQTLATAIEPLLKDKTSIIIAWSMAGLVAIELLQGSSISIESLILVSSTPCFVNTKDWKTAVDAKLFKQFSKNLQVDQRATLKRFLAIQSMGSPDARENIKNIQKKLLARGESSSLALNKGLEMLLIEDKRQKLKRLNTFPIHLISGENDNLIPHQGQKLIAQQYNIQYWPIAHAGHAVFISHCELFCALIKQCVDALYHQSIENNNDH